jgi:vacuolar protein-sorting-associated protein 4
VRDAVYEPVRRLQTAKKFKQVGDKYVPCREGEDGKAATWLDFKNDEIDIGKIDKIDMIQALKRTKPSVDKTQLAEYEEFTKTFGQEG